MSNDTELSDQAEFAPSTKEKVIPKRRKVTQACVYCRRSHMTCDIGRPCQRCIKRNIGHLCHDVRNSGPSNGSKNKMINQSTSSSQDNRMPITSSVESSISQNINAIPSNLSGLPLQFLSQMGIGQLKFASEFMGDEVSMINNLIESIDTSKSDPVNSTEKFFLTAADPSDGKLEDRLKEVINAKYEAGFLKPYNYVNGYARLQKYMDSNMSAVTRQRILNVMGTFRPTFRQVAQSLTDIDMIIVEEAFERLLLDYDRVFSSMGIPACLWRRTGEIYKCNKEFASLVNVAYEDLREGRLCIYELMAEESSANYWEKYGSIAFDPGQKAVLTSCLLKTTSLISCCFSFTIRRDKYNIPIVIVGNFLPVQLH